MFIETLLNMEYIEKRNGEVYLVTEHDVYGRHKTVRFLGLEYNENKDDEIKEEKPKNKKKKDEAK